MRAKVEHAQPGSPTFHECLTAPAVWWRHLGKGIDERQRETTSDVLHIRI